MLLAEFKMPWRDLAETSVRARAKGAGEVNLSSNSEWWRWAESNRRAIRFLNQFYGSSLLVLFIHKVLSKPNLYVYIL